MRPDGQSYYKVDVEIRMETDNGKYKKHTEQYLTLSTGCTEAEASVIRSFEKAGDIREYHIKSVTRTKIAEVV
jgi:hypothetical protein